MMSAPAFSELEVDREVRSGDIAYRLTRPLAYPLYHLGPAGRSSPALRPEPHGRLRRRRSCSSAPIALSPVSVAAGLLAAFVAFLVDWAWTFTISFSSSGWRTRTGIHLLYRRCTMLLGGMLIPLEAFPGGWNASPGRFRSSISLYQPAPLFVRRRRHGSRAGAARRRRSRSRSASRLLAIYSPRPAPRGARREDRTRCARPWARPLLIAYVKANLQAALEYRASFVSQVFAMLLNDVMWLVFWLAYFDGSAWSPAGGGSRSSRCGRWWPRGSAWRRRSAGISSASRV